MRIDVHAHLWTPKYLDLLESFGRGDTSAHRGMGAGAAEGELRARLDLMDSAGIGRQVLSATPQVPHFADEKHAVHAARHINDLYAELARQRPDRFAAFVALPLPHIDASLAELARGMDELGMVGAAVTTDVLGGSLADEAFAPVFAELERRGSVLYLHPSGCAAGTPMIAEHRMRWMVGAPVEDTIAAVQLILAGIPGRYPRLRIINSHLGGALPMLLGRLDRQYGHEAPGTPERPALAARRMWYDTVAHGHLPALRAAADSFGADRLLLGTDFPYQSGEAFREAVSYVQDALPGEDARSVLDLNAPALLGM